MSCKLRLGTGVSLWVCLTFAPSTHAADVPRRPKPAADPAPRAAAGARSPRPRARPAPAAPRTRFAPLADDATPRSRRASTPAQRKTAARPAPAARRRASRAGPTPAAPPRRPAGPTTPTAEEPSAEELLERLEQDVDEEPAQRKTQGGAADRPSRLQRFIQTLNPDVSAIAILAGAYYYDHGLRGEGNIVPQGGHDPGKTGFHLQVFELALQAEVDPYFRLDTFLAVSLQGIHFHEGYFTTLGIPGGLQLRAGQINHKFGRHNTKHLHDWVFVDNMVPVVRLLSGGQLRSLALEASWMMPLPWYSVLTVALSMPTGSFLQSFVGDRSRKQGFHIRDPRHLLYVTHLDQFYEVSADWGINLGVSYAIGPNHSGGQEENLTQLFGADLFLKFRPLRKPYSEIRFTAEWYGRLMQIPEDQLFDWGLFAQTSFRLAKRWFLALRYDMVEIADSQQLLRFDFAQQSSDPDHPNPLDDQHRGAISVTWQPTHFSQLRLQYNHNWTRRMTDAGAPGDYELSHEIVLQLQGNIGTHGAHPY